MAKQDHLDSWDNFTNNFLKIEQVKGDNHIFVCINVQETPEKADQEQKVRLTLESDQEQYDFDLNKTNATFIKNAGIRSPRLLIGKKLYFQKVPAINPKTKAQVLSLRIWKIE